MNAPAARDLLRRGRCAALATTLADAADASGYPYASLVTYACDVDASPIFLFSDLSDHTRNLHGNARASLLIEEASRMANPQTGPRVTLVGHVAVDATPRLRRRFLARHPAAELYAGFADFHIFRMKVERVHWVGGFGKAAWLGPEAVLSRDGAVAALARDEEDILAHMNRDHAEAVALYAERLLRLAGGGWQMIGVDPDGCDLRRRTALARLPFPHPVNDAEELRGILTKLAADARARPG
jgi:putative heme iron utilization protein